MRSLLVIAALLPLGLTLYLLVAVALGRRLKARSKAVGREAVDVALPPVACDCEECEPSGQRLK